MRERDLLDFLHIYKARTLHSERTGETATYHYQASTKALDELERWPSERGRVKSPEKATLERRGEPHFQSLSKKRAEPHERPNTVVHA